MKALKVFDILQKVADNVLPGNTSTGLQASTYMVTGTDPLAGFAIRDEAKTEKPLEGNFRLMAEKRNDRWARMK